MTEPAPSADIGQRLRLTEPLEGRQRGDELTTVLRGQSFHVLDEPNLPTAEELLAVGRPRHGEPDDVGAAITWIRFTRHITQLE
jgi:hypothetical protein